MAAGRIYIPPYMPARDRNGRLVSGALLTVYLNGTTTEASIYADAGLTTPLANPVVANSSGQFVSIWASDAVLYTVAVTGPGGISIGNPSVFDDVSVAVSAAVAQGSLWVHDFDEDDGDGAMWRRGILAAVAADKPLKGLPGTYIMDGTAFSADGLIGLESAGTVRIECDTGIITFAAPASTGRAIFSLKGGANADLVNVKFDATNVTSNFAVKVEGAGDFKCRNGGVTYKGLRFVGTNGRVEIDGFEANRTQGHAISSGSATGETFGYTNGGWIKGVDALDCKKSGVNWSATKNLEPMVIERPIVRWKRWETEGVAYPSKYAAVRLGNGTSNTTVIEPFGEGVYRVLRLTDTDNCWAYGVNGLNCLGPFVLFNSKDQVARNSGVIGVNGVGPCRYLGRADQSPATGTIVTSTGSATVTGTGTKFIEELIVGQGLFNTSRTLIGTIQSIASDTSLTLTGNAALTINPGAAFQFGAVDEDGEGISGEGSVAFAVAEGVSWAVSGVSISADEYILQLGTNLAVAGSATLQNRDFINRGNDFNCFDDMLAGDLVFDDAENLIGRVQAISAKTYWTDAKETTSQGSASGADHASQTITLDAGSLLTDNTGTGTITVALNGTAVVGVGTAFSTELAVGVNLYDGTGAYVGRITAIADNENLTLATGGAKVAVTGAGFLYSGTYYQRRPDPYFFTPGTGTITASTGSDTIEGGVGTTAFTTQLQAGDIIFNDSRQLIGVVQSITDIDTLVLTANALRNASAGSAFQFGRPKKVARGLEIARTATKTVVDLDDVYVNGAILQHYVDEPEGLRERAGWTINKTRLARLDATKRRGEVWDVSDVVPPGPVRSNGTVWAKASSVGYRQSGALSSDADFTVTYLDFPPVMGLTANLTAERTVTLSETGLPDGATYTFNHRGTTTFSWLIKSAGGTTILTLRPGQIGTVVYDGSGTPTWRRAGIADGTATAPLITTASGAPSDTPTKGDIYARSGSSGPGTSLYVAEAAGDWRAWISGPMPMTYATMAALTAAQYTNQTFFVTDIGTNGSIWRCTGSAFVPMTRITSTWAGLPAAASYSGLEAFVSDVGVDGSLWRSNGTRWVRQGPITIYSNASVAGLSTAITGVVGETKAPGFTSPIIPAGILNAGDLVIAECSWVFANAVGTRRPAIRFGAADNLTGTLLAQATAYSTSFFHATIGGKNLIVDATNQVVLMPSPNTGNYGATGAAMTTGTVDTANPVYVVASCTMAGAGDTAILHAMTVRIE